MSASISCKELLEILRNGGWYTDEAVRELADEQPNEFFRSVIEELSDSFDPGQVAAYERLMRVWIPETPRVRPVVPSHVDTVYVLSRVTLGADIKITSVILDAMKRVFPGAAIVFVGNRKCVELFAADLRISHVEADYPRKGPVNARLEFARDLRQKLSTPRRIVIDPDSRITQLGLVAVAEPEHSFHFPSRTANYCVNLTELTNHWLRETFGCEGAAYIAPPQTALEGDGPRAAVSLGVGGNDSKRIGGDFERDLIHVLAERYKTVWIDRGAGGEEAARVTKAAEGVSGVRYWEGSFAGFASIISQCDFYAGYDSAGQHAAAACGTPLISFFAGAPSERFRERWAPYGEGPVRVIMSGSWTSTKLKSLLAENSN